MLYTAVKLFLKSPAGRLERFEREIVRSKLATCGVKLSVGASQRYDNPLFGGAIARRWLEGK